MSAAPHKHLAQGIKVENKKHYWEHVIAPALQSARLKDTQELHLGKKLPD